MIKKVLVIDDDVDLVDKIREKLEVENYEVIGAFDGEDGLEKARSERPDLIILDIVMPKMTGYEFVANARKDNVIRMIPIVVITKHEALLKFFESERVKGYLLKPLKLQELLSKVRDCIGEVEGKRILIIDDEPEVVDALKIRLMDKRYVVVTASNGKEGLEKIKVRKPDIIVLDIFMPVMNGCEFFKIVKDNPESADIPIIVLTPRGVMRDYFETFGADEVISKPFAGDEVVSRINSLLTNKALVLCDDDDILLKIKAVMEDRHYEQEIVITEEEMLERAKKTRYKVIVVFLACVQKGPVVFISALRSTRNKDTSIVVYSNSKVKGTESNNIVVIRELRRKWMLAGAEQFFDLRITDVDFPVLFDRSVGVFTEEY